jgi:uncharacterized GH25 family protein
MKKIIITLAVILFALGQSFAHFLWIETNAKGKIGKEQEIRVYFGEYTYGLMEKVEGEAYPKVKDFSLWVTDEEGTQTKLTVSPQENHYLAKFTPTKNGTYTVLLNNDQIDVIDYTKYNFGIFKTHYHSVAKIQVGEKVNTTIADNPSGITVKNMSEASGKTKLQVLYKNKALPKNEVKVFVADQWSKTLETDENGFVSFDLPWDTKYVIETTIKEEVPGNYKGQDYQFVWHCVTHSFTK